MGEELGRDLHVRNDKRRVQEGVNRSRAADCAFRKGRIGPVPNKRGCGTTAHGSRSELPIEVLPYWYHCSDERERDSNRGRTSLGTNWEQIGNRLGTNYRRSGVK